MNSATLTRRSRTNFSWAFWGLEKKRRYALNALYAFCRSVDDIVDHAKDVAIASTELGKWKSAIDRLERPSVFDPLIAHELSFSSKIFPIQKEDLYRIIEGVEMDLQKKRYETFDELLVYCDGVASAVGLASLAIFGAPRDETLNYAFATGRALQLTNILRDVGVDARMDRIYIPKEDLEKFGYRERSLLSRTYNQKFVELMEFQKDRTLSFYKASEEALPEDQRKKYPAAELMRKLYRALLKRIEERRYDVFSRKVRVSPARKLAIALSVWVPHFLRKGS